MKKQIRRGVFETNSSSVHSLTMCSGEEYTKWENGELYKERWGSTFKTREEIIEELRSKTSWRSNELVYTNVDWDNSGQVDELIRKNDYVTEEEFWEDVDDETFSNEYKTPSGEKVIAFGYYGYDS